MPLTNSLNLPQPFVDAVTSNYRYKDKRYSVTQILGGIRPAILSRRHQDEITEDVADMVWMIFGSAVHSILEKSKESETQLKENWVSAELPNGYTLSGIFDLYDDATKTVTDYKTATVWKVIYGEWDDYRKQLLMYCWMLRKMGFDARKGQIVAMLKDHSKSKAKFDASYPKHPVYTISWEFTDQEFEELESWLVQRFEEIEAAEKLPDDELPLCTAEERWAKPDKWAVRKKGNKRALKVHDSQESAESHLESLGNGYEIEFRPGADGKCGEYCSCHEFCDYWKKGNANG